ncbi:plasmid replication protein, CyRepA1 family [Gluconobacter japonicus]|uniref:plasmid replication protein, CyRepA1 family n=1 Tax=Gluconobacter japonicus TaxID=376620 RepID=UPI0012E85C79|nr:plasmid replication protein, CyRepA1 family [Gluconobacter japonicus]
MSEALSEASREHWKIPSLTRADTIAKIRNTAPEGAWTDGIEREVCERIDWHIKEREGRARLLVTLPDDVATRHDVQEAAELPTLTADDYQGVIILNLPMGAGKTRKMGVPFIRHASGKGRAVAIAPLTSLVDQMAEIFEADHYARIAPSDIEVCDRLAVCLPSIIREDHAAIHAEAEYIFIDEILSCLAFLASPQCGKDPQKAFHALVHRIRHARCVMVADANIPASVVRFLEYCRPDERFKIIRQPVQDTGKKVGYHIGKDALASSIGEILTRLEDGQNLWIACEAPETAKLITGMIEGRGFSSLGVWPDNKGNKAQGAFLSDPEAEGVRYRAIVHSPVIQSGVHIADAGQHFDHVFWIGAGMALTADKVMQTLGRVRYAKTFTLGLLQNNKQATPDSATLMEGLRMASVSEGLPDGSGTVYDRFTAARRAEHAYAVSDAHMAIITVLRHAGWSVHRLDRVSYGAALSDEIKSQREANSEAWKVEVLTAPILSREGAETLQKQRGLNTAQSASLEAYAIRSHLGVSDLTSEIYDFWDGGRVIGKLERFLSMTGRPSNPDVDRVALCHQRFPKAVAAAYARLFRGHVLASDMRLSPDDVRDMMRGITQADAIEYAFLGIIDPGPVYRYDRKGNLKPYQPPMDQPGRFWRMVMERVGLAGKGFNNGTTGLQDFGLKDGSWLVIEAAAEQRRSGRNSIITIRDKGVSSAGIEAPTEPVSPAMFSADAFLSELETQRIHPRLMPTARALANEAFCLVRPFLDMRHTVHHFGKIWLPMANENGMQVFLTVPVPDFMAAADDETFYPIEHGAEIVFPFDIDLSALDRARYHERLGPLFSRVKADPIPAHVAEAILQDVLAA